MLDDHSGKINLTDEIFLKTEFQIPLRQLDNDQKVLLIQAAGLHGQVELLKILKSNTNLGQKQLDNAFIYASARGHREVVEFLLDDATITTELLKTSISKAANNGNRDVVELLLKDSRIYNDIPMFGDNLALNAGELALMSAARSGHDDIVALLMKDSHVGERQKISAFNQAAEHGNNDVLNVMLKDDSFDAMSTGRIPLANAASAGLLDTLRFLLEHPRINAKEYGGYALAEAIRADRREIVEYILQNERVDIFGGFNNFNPLLFAVREANGNKPIVELLLKEERIKGKLTDIMKKEITKKWPDLSNQLN